MQRLLISALMAGASLLFNASPLEGAVIVREQIDIPIYATSPEGPPAPVVEVRGDAPDEGHMWIGGYWERSGPDWIWVRGRWIVRPHAEAIWVEPIWIRGGDHWHRAGGHWR